jgi:hypothetical protein
MEENIALIRFVRGYAENGVSKDGMPSYRPCVKIIKEVPPLTKVEYEATEDDFENPQFRDAYEAFKRTEKAMKADAGADGFPLALWPACSPSEFMMCAARGISTVEQLAKLAKRREVPLEIQELAVRAQSMIAQQANIGKFEAIIRQKEAELAAILEEVRELRMAVAQRDARINSLMTMTAYGQQPGGTVLHG